MTVNQLPAASLRELALALRGERDRLVASLGLLVEAERELSESQADESGPVGDQGDVASDLAEQELDLALEQTSRARLAEVEAALHRLDTGQYGLCESCGGAVPPARLEAVPWARRCVACAAHQEAQR